MVLQNWNTFNAMCTALSKSGKTGDIKSTEGMLAVCIQGAELGLPPMTSINSIDVISGKTAISARLAQALVLRDMPGSDFEIITETAEVCEVKLTVPGRKPYTSRYTIEEAKTAKLIKKDGNWEKNPVDMLFAKAVIRACRRVCPDVLAGMYCVEEFAESGSMEGIVDVTPAEESTVSKDGDKATEGQASTTGTAKKSTAKAKAEPKPEPKAEPVKAELVEDEPDKTEGKVAKETKPEPAKATDNTSDKPSADGPKAAMAQLNMLANLKKTLHLGDSASQSQLSVYEVKSARDLSTDQALHLTCVLRKRVDDQGK